MKRSYYGVNYMKIQEDACAIVGIILPCNMREGDKENA